MERLNNDMAIKLGLTKEENRKRPIKVIQFGEGNFLRAFVDWTVQRLNDAGMFDGNVAIVQPMPTGMVAKLQEQDNLYTVVLDGVKDGVEIHDRKLIDSIGKSLSVYDQWDEYLALADDPATQIIISNTTEAGIAVVDSDTPDMRPPSGFPAKLTLLLKRRYDKGLPGFLIIPCELIADNGKALKGAINTVAKSFGFGQDFIDWVNTKNTFVSTLVDRIVPGYPRDQAAKLCDEIGYDDQMMVKAEPFYLWVVAGDTQARAKVEELLPASKLGIDLVTTDEVQPYRERKVYLLNAPHTTLAQVARLAGIHTVGESMNDKIVHSFIVKEMNEEIIPVLTLPKAELDRFAGQVLERFSNPFNEHKLDSIGLNSISKYAVRILPLIGRNLKQQGKLPSRIVLALAALLYTYGGFAGDTVKLQDDPKLQKDMRDIASSDSFVHDALSDADFWGEDISGIEGLEELVKNDMSGISTRGIRAMLEDLA